MRTSFAVTFALLAIPALAAPLSHSNQPRGAVQFAKEVAVEIGGAARIAIGRIGSKSALNQGLLNIVSAESLHLVNAEQANALLKAAERGDAKVIQALNSIAAATVGKEVQMSEEMRSILTRYNGLGYKEYPFTPNMVDEAVIVGKAASRARWNALSLRQRWALATIPTVAGFGVAAGAIGGAGYGIYKAVKSDYDLPSELQEEDMAALKQYIAGHPDEYQKLMKDVNDKVKGLTDAQKEELLAAAPQSFIDSTSGSSEKELD